MRGFRHGAPWRSSLQQQNQQQITHNSITGLTRSQRNPPFKPVRERHRACAATQAAQSANQSSVLLSLRPFCVDSTAPPRSLQGRRSVRSSLLPSLSRSQRVPRSTGGFDGQRRARAAHRMGVIGDERTNDAAAAAIARYQNRVVARSTWLTRPAPLLADRFPPTPTRLSSPSSQHAHPHKRNAVGAQRCMQLGHSEQDWTKDK